MPRPIGSLCFEHGARKASLALLLLGNATLAIILLSSQRLLDRSERWGRSHFVSPPSDQEIAWERALDDQIREIRKGGEYYLPLREHCDIEGVASPKLYPASEAGLDDQSEVVGIEVNGKAHAFALDSMDSPERHILNLMISNTPVTVTYCNLVDCVRVFTGDGPAAIPMRVGGLDIQWQMVVLLDGIRYGQASRAIPLQDLPFARTTWGDWRKLHPGSVCYYLK